MVFSCPEVTKWSKSLPCDITLSCPEITADSPVLTSKAQTEIDNELAALRERMRALRTRRNSLSPISSIPPEILGTIFVHHVEQTQLLHAPDAPAVLSWLFIGHVCRHWREVALGTLELWATPFLNSSQATEEMLLRSKMAPLKLRIGRNYRMDCVKKTLLHIERLQEITFPFFNGGTTHRCVTVFFNKLSSCFAPKLQSLSLEGGFRRTQVTIPTSFPAPNLRSLQIKRCNLSWTSSVLTGLTVLNITKLSPECLPTLDELISALRRMPALRTLNLEDALPTLPPQMTSLSCASRATNVRLPHLKHLRFAAQMLEVANVLARIELQEATLSEVRFVCGTSSAIPHQAWNLSFPVISRALESCFKVGPDQSRQVPRSMRLFCRSGCIRLHCNAVRNPSSWSKSGTCLDLDLSAEGSITLQFDFTDNMERTILSDLQKVVPLGNIEAMYFHISFRCWDGFWTSVLGRGATYNLAYMYLRGSRQALEELLKSLRSQNHSVSRRVHGREQQGPIFAPVLSHLVLHDLEFGPYILNRMRPSLLLDVLINRVHEGRGLDHLEFISTTGILARDVKLLREVVADVSWDGYESFVDDYDHDYDSDDTIRRS